MQLKGDFNRFCAGTVQNVDPQLGLILDPTRKKKENNRWFSQWRHQILKSKTQSLLNYLKVVEDDLEINRFSSFQFRDVFRFEITAFWISKLSTCVTAWYKAIWLKTKWSMNRSSLRLSSTLGDVFIHMYFISYAKSNRFHRKVNSRGFRWLSTAILVDHMAIQNSIKLGETLRQKTQKRCSAQTWELERWLKDFFLQLSSSWTFPLNDFEFSFIVAWQCKLSIEAKWKTEPALIFWVSRSYRAS